MLHVGFALAIGFWRGNQRFTRLFAAGWMIEAVRAAILLPWVHSAGGIPGVWFGLADLLHVPATGLLLSSTAALVGRKLPRRFNMLYYGLTIPALLVGRILGADIIDALLPVSDPAVWAVVFNLTVMFVPATVIRLVVVWWMYQAWTQERDAGAFITAVFGFLFAIGAIIVPFQFYFSWYPMWWNYIWCLRMFGFSMGILMLIISHAENVLRDNKELKAALEKIAATPRLIGEERLKALGQMAAGVAHDLNNSLTPLLAYGHLIERNRDQPEKVAELANLVQLAASDTAATVKRLDHFYRKAHNREMLVSLDLAETVHEAITLTRPRWQDQDRVSGKDISLHARVLARPTVKGDASQLRSVLTNLIFNACDAITHTGTIEISVAACDGTASVAVRDTGSGMSSEQLKHCLEPFYSTKASGSGLGLSECYGIIRQHGGEITVDSVVGESTTVRFTLPIESAPDDYIPESTAPPFEDQIGDILLIDDDPDVAHAVKMILGDIATRVECVHDGLAAFEMLSERNFDVIITDQGLPGMDGIEVMQTVRRRCPGIPVVIISGWSLPEAIESPPDAFVAKPIQPDELCETVRAVCRESSFSARPSESI